MWEGIGADQRNVDFDKGSTIIHSNEYQMYSRCCVNAKGSLVQRTQSNGTHAEELRLQQHGMLSPLGTCCLGGESSNHALRLSSPVLMGWHQC